MQVQILSRSPNKRSNERNKMNEYENMTEDQLLQELLRLTKLRDEKLSEIISLDEQIQKLHEGTDQ